jgi:transcriptional regulator with XRE-family HTH domain
MSNEIQPDILEVDFRVNDDLRIFNAIVGVSLRIIRKRAKISQSDLADLMGQSQSYISKRELGVVSPSCNDIFVILNIVGFPIIAFFAACSMSFYAIKENGVSLIVVNRLTAEQIGSRLNEGDLKGLCSVCINAVNPKAYLQKSNNIRMLPFRNFISWNTFLVETYAKTDLEGKFFNRKHYVDWKSAIRESSEQSGKSVGQLASEAGVSSTEMADFLEAIGYADLGPQSVLSSSDLARVEKLVRAIQRMRSH